MVVIYILFIFLCRQLLHYNPKLANKRFARNRIFHGCEARIEKSILGSLFGITRLCRVMPKCDPEGRIFLSAPNNHDRFCFLQTFCSPALDCNVEVAPNEPCSYTLMSTIVKVDVMTCDVTMMSTPNILMTELVVTSYTTNVLTTCIVILFFSIPRVR